MRKILISFLLVSVSAFTVFPQIGENKDTDGWKKYILVEAGFIYPDGSIKESIPLRQDLSYYYVDQYSNGYVSSETYGLSLGLRYAYYLPKLKSGISAGLRYYGLDGDGDKRILLRQF